MAVFSPTEKAKSIIMFTQEVFSVKKGGMRKSATILDIKILAKLSHKKNFCSSLVFVTHSLHAIRFCLCFNLLIKHAEEIIKRIIKF